MTPGQSAYRASFGAPLSGAMPSNAWEVINDDSRRHWEHLALHAILHFGKGSPGGVTPGQALHEAGLFRGSLAWAQMPASYHAHYERIAQAAIDCGSAPASPADPVAASSKPITRAHREAAVIAMYPRCHVDSPMWLEFVEGGETASYRTPAAVAQAIANAGLSPLEAKRSTMNAAAMTWVRVYGAMVLRDSMRVDPQDALRAIIERDADLRQVEEFGDK